MYMWSIYFFLENLLYHSSCLCFTFGVDPIKSSLSEMVTFYETEKAEKNFVSSEDSIAIRVARRRVHSKTLYDHFSLVYSMFTSLEAVVWESNSPSNSPNIRKNLLHFHGNLLAVLNNMNLYVLIFFLKKISKSNNTNLLK